MFQENRVAKSVAIFLDVSTTSRGGEGDMALSAMCLSGWMHA